MKYWLHAEDFGWPPKKTKKTINAEQNADKIVALYPQGVAMTGTDA